MYKFKEKINSVEGYIDYNDNLLICSDKYVFKINEETVLDNIDATSLFVKDNLLFFHSNDIQEYIYKDKIKEFKFSLFYNSYMDNSILGTSMNYPSKTEDLYFFNLELDTKELIKENLVIYCTYRTDNFFFFTDKSATKIFNLNIKTKEFEWQIDLSKYGEVKNHTFEVVNGNLWLVCKVDNSHLDTVFPVKEYYLLVIDVVTGEIKNSFKNDYQFSQCYLCFINEKRSLISLKKHLLIEYDTHSLKEKRRIELSSLLEHKLAVKRITVYKDKIYFTAVYNKTQIVSNVLGVLDYHTLEVLWTTEVESYQLPQVTDTKLYIKNIEEELLVFERTNMEV